MRQLRWWQKGVIYQVYLPSFADGNGDGFGDLPGLMEHLDYLQDLGVDAIWLSPHYPSPMADWGYDIADYQAIDERFGTMADFQRLVRGAQRRGIRLLLDLVLNHTSDQHPWFVESRSGVSKSRRDWYVWQTGRGQGPPNNWVSRFGGSAWEHDAATGQYYYHYFFKQQPDLNWRNPQVQRAMWDVVRFWLDLGVDGFRLDAIDQLLEDPAGPDHDQSRSLAELNCRLMTSNDPEELQKLAAEKQALLRHQGEQPGLHEILAELRSVIDEYPDRVLIGETDNLAYCGNGSNELHMVFNFPLMRASCLEPEVVRENQRQRLSELPQGAWPCNTLNNHDFPRAASRHGRCGHGGPDSVARLCIGLLLTLRGTPVLYQGEEIGMTDLAPSHPEALRDGISVWIYRAAVEELGIEPAVAMEIAVRFGRDKCRTPMQWTAGPNAGFSRAGVRTWLPVHPNHRRGINVTDQQDAPDSLLCLYRRLLNVRRQNPALVAGDYRPLEGQSPDLLAFLRTDQSAAQTCLVVLNMGSQWRRLQWAPGDESSRSLFSSRERPLKEPLTNLDIAPFEVYIGEMCQTRSA